jgi:hypothetical protein
MRLQLRCCGWFAWIALTVETASGEDPVDKESNMVQLRYPPRKSQPITLIVKVYLLLHCSASTHDVFIATVFGRAFKLRGIIGLMC